MLRPIRVVALAVAAFALATAGHAQAPVSPWSAQIDAYWGGGLPTAEALHRFDEFWDTADARFAAFHRLPIDWDTLRARYRPEIEAGVSRGRFAAILNHLALALREPHTYAIDSLVNVQTEPGPGVPILYGAVRGDNRYFGACLTPLPDSTLLVYDAVPDHPLGLEPGDIVLGYDGERWADLYPRLLAAELPLTTRWQFDNVRPASWFSSTWGSAPSAWTAGWLTAAGMNWHLFTTIDVVRRATGQTDHVPVSALEGQDEPIVCTEQLPVGGVALPATNEGRYVSWGRVEGANVGYIYVWNWLHPWQPDVYFRQAIEELAFGSESVDGLIVDFRYNPGGLVNFANDGLNLLFDRTIETLEVGWRTDPDDRYTLEPAFNLWATIYGEPSSHFDRPIAILTGPGAASAGDCNAIRLAYHQRARVFGRSTSASFGASHGQTYPGWGYAISIVNAYRHDAPDIYLNHTEQRVDEPVWLTPDDAARGEDTVVRHALDWISVASGVEPSATSDRPFLSEGVPNPFTATTTVTLSLPRHERATVVLYDVVGREVVTVHDGALGPGLHRLTIPADGLASGTYVLVARTRSGEGRRLLTLRR